MNSKCAFGKVAQKPVGEMSIRSIHMQTLSDTHDLRNLATGSAAFNFIWSKNFWKSNGGSLLFSSSACESGTGEAAPLRGAAESRECLEAGKLLDDGMDLAPSIDTGRDLGRDAMEKLRARAAREEKEDEGVVARGGGSLFGGSGGGVAVGGGGGG